MTERILKTITLMESGMTISKALKEVYKARKVSIPYIEGSLRVPVAELGFSNRVYYALMRMRFHVLEDVLDYMARNGWNSIKNLGRASAEEIYEKFLDVAWDKLDTDKRAEFLLRVDAENEAK